MEPQAVLFKHGSTKTIIMDHFFIEKTNKNLTEESKKTEPTKIFKDQADQNKPNARPVGGIYCNIDGDASLSGGTVQSEELERQGNPHSSNPLHTTEGRFLQRYPDRMPISWPKLNENKIWEEFESSVCSKLHAAGSVAFCLSGLETAIYDVAVRQFGHTSQKK